MIGRTLLISLILGISLQAVAKPQNQLKDLYFGEALFYAHQGEYFEAISRLDTELGQYYGVDEPELNSLFHHIDHAEFSVGDFELLYRMHNRAGRAIKVVIEGNVEEVVRNEALFRLAKMYYQKQQRNNALHTIERIKGKLPPHLEHEEPYLRAQIYIVNAKFDQAIELLTAIESKPGMKGFAGYNLGIARILSGSEAQGVLQLDKVGKTPGEAKNLQGMRDKANLVLGYRLLEAGKHEMAKQYLDRVRIKGAFSNKALLGSGWAAVAKEEYARALVPWTVLAKRNVTNESVQEALMAVPFAYGKLDLYGKAALLYGKALESYGKEIDRLDASVKSIREGSFLEAVVREEIKRDKNWLVKLRDLPNTPETYYLMQMMASHDFQESLKNYFDLVELQKRLLTWERDLIAFQEIIDIRKAYYEPLLPGVKTEFQQLDSKMKLRVEQRNALDNRLNKMTIAPRPEVLINMKEREILDALKYETVRLTKSGAMDEKSKARIDRLKGVIHWNVVTQYDDRFTTAYNNLRQLDQHVENLNEIYGSFVRTRQTATQSYRGYEKNIRQIENKIRQAKGRIKTLLARQGNLIETMAVKELERRRKRLEEYQVKARFALADSYDRAAKKQTDQEIKQQVEKEKIIRQEEEKLENEKKAKEKKEKDKQETQNAINQEASKEKASEQTEQKKSVQGSGEKAGKKTESKPVLDKKTEEKDK